MLVILRNESGRSEERSFSDMKEAAQWALDLPEYGISLVPEGGEALWDHAEWQQTLDYYG